MLSSPFQQPSRRQNALALQIQEARSAGDEALLSRLISQWVHRYGFAGAAELDLSLPEPTISDSQFSPPADEASDAPPVDPLPMPVAEESSWAPEIEVDKDEIATEESVFAGDVVVVDDKIVAEDEVDVEDEVDADDKVVAEDETIVEQKEEIAAEETLLQRTFSAAPVPAPPISTPRSLRRWLPRREDDAFPKAS